MPISKNGKPYYTDAQYNVARYESSALEYAKASGYQLEKKGNWWSMKEHDSFVFGSNGMWFWNSRDMKGGAIEFLTMIEHKSMVDAVLTLAGEQAAEKQNNAPFPKKENTEEKRSFDLPPKADNFKRLFAYLCGSRGLDKEIVQELVRQGKIYESAKDFTKDGETKSLHNAVFVGFDKDGNPRSGFQRGLTTNAARPFKRDVAGSEKDFAFCIEGAEGVNTVAVFEASIDAISHATITKLAGQDWHSCDRIALGGIAFVALQQYLSEHPDIKNIVLCVDADQAGDKAAESLKTALIDAGYSPENGYHCERQLPTGHKDFNEYLMTYKAALQEQSENIIGRKNENGHEADGFFPEVSDEEETENEPN